MSLCPVFLSCVSGFLFLIPHFISGLLFDTVAFFGFLPFCFLPFLATFLDFGFITLGPRLEVKLSFC